MSRPPEIALTQAAPLTPAQQAFRQSANRHLDFALPLNVWLDHNYSIYPSQRRKPVARNGSEGWYDFTQVVKRGLNPRSKRRVRVVTGGKMAGARSGKH